jgi:hypothetical protein
VIQRLLCQSCGRAWTPDAQDVKDGWHTRKTGGIARAGHPVNLDQSSLICDTCGSPILAGTECFAVTHWRNELPPEAWEIAFFASHTMPVCQRCNHYEPKYQNLGWCCLFNRSTVAGHGLRCTAFEPKS